MPTGVYRRKTGALGGPPIQKICARCSKPYWAKAAHADRRIFCSRECKGESRSEQSLVEKSCIVCGTAFRVQSYRNVKCCSEACQRRSRAVRTKRNPTGWYLNYQGYLARSIKHRTVLQHRMIMEEHLGRPLHDYENIHHKNGVKDDNRLENLEVWVTRQPKGQRPKDTDEWAIAWLQSRGYTVTKA